MTPVYWLDLLHAHLRNKGRFFTGGWGDPEVLDLSLVQRQPPPAVEMELENRDGPVSEYRFRSPVADLPTPSQTAYFRLVLPEQAEPRTPICLHLAATGDEGFETRHRLLAAPLAQQGIGSVILENPFYGRRRPDYQDSTYIHTVSQLWQMGMATVAESRAILAWLESIGYERLGVSGVSMGGQMASQVAALYHRPLAVCACIAPHSASTVFLEGVLSHFCDFEALGGGQEARTKLRLQLDGTDLRLFPRPTRTDCCLWICGKNDAYVLPHSSQTTWATWPGSEIRWLPSGHVSSVLLHRRAYLRGIRESFARYELSFSEPDWLP